MSLRPWSFGPNVLIFDPTMTNIQSQMDAVFSQQQYNQFGTQRYAYLFKPGQYNNLDVNLGFYTQVLGLGQSPDDVTINGYLHSDGILPDQNATVNFWRAAENLAVIPTNSGNYVILGRVPGDRPPPPAYSGHRGPGKFYRWKLVQRRIPGGFQGGCHHQFHLATTMALPKRHLGELVRRGLEHGVCRRFQSAGGNLARLKVYTTITNTPLIAEKPYLYLDSNGNYAVMVPALQTNTLGTTWASGPTPGVSIPISQFYIAHADTDNAASINAALNSGLNLILTPGVYQLTDSLQVTRPDTIILGLGYATLVPQTGTPALVISDVDGVKVAGLIFDAGPVQSPTLLQVGTTNSSLNHSGDPICPVRHLHARGRGDRRHDLELPADQRE